ncbi:MAG: purine-nucleoside phosphorylase, partial [Verrucomicrobiales bacterium]|nr:purine-nucleoside phosphorylase [Verrucomicrobiales bacterium]
SGLGSFVDRIEAAESIPYSKIDGLPVSKVPGHEGRFVFGELNGTRLVIAQGRVHLYEGWTAPEIAAGVRCMAEMGVQKLVLTNAAGIVNPNFLPGQWMQISDHLNFTGQSPLFGGANFVDQTEVYSRSWRAQFSAEAKNLGLDLAEGVYAWMPGPQYETPAEIRMLRTLGADAVGMSTVPEAIQARALGMEVAGFSCLTNFGAGMTDDLLDHSEVMEMGAIAAGKLVELLEASLG